MPKFKIKNYKYQFISKILIILKNISLYVNSQFKIMSRQYYLPLESIWNDPPNAEKFQQIQKIVDSKKKSIVEWYLSSNEDDQTTESRVTIRTLRFSPA